ncbi:MAG: hypothetical protein HC836_00815 [Richelia sp. RM2_1_2]|nr:hypothetical protein [Richelia sp. SM2_1_7]NJM18345.1 hypothetical protein [Richelia sp. SM1_7_0]NJN10228.1 hypothetical protein [Richelia sp. RM1_1_1]NJO28636.1 hypothetical protein [Richelia sp. SL_2_1]NJO56963.1 hypothetical protein [Richelia sp. RM2_1_2]
MTPDEIEVALQEAFNRCDAARCPLTDGQKMILLQVLSNEINGNSSQGLSKDVNPLLELTSEELQIFSEFVKEQEKQNRFWKVELLNDWLQEKDSGVVQFIRERYGIQWLSKVEKYHFDQLGNTELLKLKIGDRIEVCNGLWEWVQEGTSCEPEWFVCTVISLEEIVEGDNSYTTCTIRFNDGAEYQIQGIYQWNSYQWRWGKK